MRHNAQVIQNLFEHFPFLILHYSQVRMNDHAAIQFITYFTGENVCADQINSNYFTSCMYLLFVSETSGHLDQPRVVRGSWLLEYTSHNAWPNDVTSGIPERHNQGIYIRYLNENHFEPMHAGLMAIWWYVKCIAILLWLEYVLFIKHSQYIIS